MRLVPPLVLVLAAAVGAAADIAVRAAVDRKQLSVGEPFVLTIEVGGAQNVAPPALGDVQAFQSQYLGPTTQLSIINGQMSANVSFRYRLIPLREGQFTLGPFAVNYEGKRYDTAPIGVHVSQPAQAPAARAPVSGAGGLRLVVSPSKPEGYVHERMGLQVTLYVPADVRVDDVQYPKVEGDSVVLDKLSEPIQRDEIVDGQRFRTLRFTSAMTPLRSGVLELPASMGMSVLTPRRRSLWGRDPFFDRFFGDAFTDRREVQLRAEPGRVVVAPLPESGRPMDFSGAVGRFDFALTAKPTDLTAGDPVTVRMRISGDGNLDSVTAPVIPAEGQFRVYDALSVKEEEGEGNRVFEQVLIPKQAGVSEVPPVRFSYFDPETVKYRTITRGPIALTVHARAAGEEPRIFSPGQITGPAAALPPVGRDIVYIKDSAGRFQRRGAAFYRGAWFLSLQLLPVGVFVGVLLYVRRRDRLAADPRSLRLRQARRQVRRTLAGLGKGAADGPRFYDELSTVLSAYLGAKLDLPPGGVERERVIAKLAGDGWSEELRQHVDSFFELAERVRYAPNSAAAARRDEALALARFIVSRLQRERSGKGRVVAGLMAGLLALSLLSFALCIALLVGNAGQAAVNPAEPHTGFFRGNAAYAAGRYAEAVREYEQVLASGQESGALHFNLGNAQFKNGDLGQAIASYERARRLLPRDPDVRSNLSYAQELAQTEPVPARLWHRLAFPLAFGLTAGELAVLASAAWLSFWVALTVRRVAPRVRVAFGRAAWVFAVLCLIVAGNLAYRVAELELRHAAVVTAAGETPVRFEPSSSGTEHFPVRAGTRLDVTDEREGWLQVRRQDGRRGWIPSTAVTRLRSVDAP